MLWERCSAVADSRPPATMLAENVRRRMGELGLTIRGLKEKAGGMSTSTIQGVLGGGSPRQDTVERLAAAFGCSVSDLYASAQARGEKGVAAAVPPDARVDRLIGLLEKLEADVSKALNVADKNSDAVKQMSADTHALVNRLLSPRPLNGAGGDDEQAAAREGNGVSVEQTS